MSLPEWEVAALADIAEPGAHEFSVGDGDWPFRGFVVRSGSGVYAYANHCPHAGHALNLSPDRFFNADESLLLCSSHGALFEPDSGYCVAGPCAGEKLRSLECRVVDGVVLVRAPASLRD